MNHTREDILIRLREAYSNAKRCTDDIDYIGTSLQKGWIDPGLAVEWIHAAGLAEILADITTQAEAA